MYSIVNTFDSFPTYHENVRELLSGLPNKLNNLPDGILKGFMCK